MNGERYFLDTFFAAALLNARDRFHNKAHDWLDRVRGAREVWTTEAVLIEIADTLSAIDRRAAAEFIRSLRQNTNVRVAKVDSVLLENGLRLYESSRDKTWGLTDCMSFVAMRERRLSAALTADEHFMQAGFRAVLAE